MYGDCPNLCDFVYSVLEFIFLICLSGPRRSGDAKIASSSWCHFDLLNSLNFLILGENLLFFQTIRVIRQIRQRSPCYCYFCYILTNYRQLTCVFYFLLLKIQGALMVSALFEIFIGFTGLIGFLLRFIGPISIAPTITLIGVALFNVAADQAGKKNQNE